MGGQEQQQGINDRMYVDKRDLVTFIAGVVNSTAEVKSKSEKNPADCQSSSASSGTSGTDMGRSEG